MSSDNDERADRDWDRLRQINWNEEAKNLLKAALKRRNLSYRLLAERLARMGVKESEANLRNKISRGSFTAAFFLQCLAAVRTFEISFRDIVMDEEARTRMRA